MRTWKSGCPGKTTWYSRFRDGTNDVIRQCKTYLSGARNLMFLKVVERHEQKRIKFFMDSVMRNRQNLTTRGNNMAVIIVYSLVITVTSHCYALHEGDLYNNSIAFSKLKKYSLFLFESIMKNVQSFYPCVWIKTTISNLFVHYCKLYIIFYCSVRPSGRMRIHHIRLCSSQYR